MKKILTLVTVLLSSISVSAQFMNAGSSSSENSDGWNEVYVQYNIVKNGGYDKLDKVTKDDVSGTMNGFTVGYNKAFSISQTTPVYLLVGGAFEYNFKSADYSYDYGYSSSYGSYKYRYDYDYSFKAYSIKVPVSITYHYDINEKIAIEPFAGLNARYYLSAKIDRKYEHYLNGKLRDSKDDTIDPFSSDDTNKNTANHFILGGQIGVTAVFNKNITATVSYDTDFSKVHDKLDDKCYRFNFGVGYRF